MSGPNELFNCALVNEWASHCVSMYSSTRMRPEVYISLEVYTPDDRNPTMVPGRANKPVMGSALT